MKTLVLVATATLALGCGGCESVSEAAKAMRERIAGPDATEARTYSASQREVYEAVKATAEKMGYRFVRGGPAQGEFEGISRVRPGERMGTARQQVVKAELKPALDGGTEVSVRFTEILESDSSNRAGVATEAALRGTPQYEVFLRGIQEALDQATAP